MSEHEITVSHMVLHILDPEAGVPVLSNREIDPSEDGFDFTEKLIRKMLDDENSKNAVFFDGPNRTAELCASLFSGATGFLDATRDLAGGLFEIMSQHPEIPAADSRRRVRPRVRRNDHTTHALRRRAAWTRNKCRAL